MFICQISQHNPFFLTQVWVANENSRQRLEDIPIPFDVKNILGEIHFKDKDTRSKCRGWLVLKSLKYLKADILFPGCEFDCRFHIRGRRGRMSNNFLLPVSYLLIGFIFHTRPRFLSRFVIL